MYTGWKRTVKQEGGLPIVYMTDSRNNDWYDLLPILEKSGKWIVSVWDDSKAVCWATNKGLNGRHAPSEGQTLYVVDDFEFGEGRAGIYFDGDKFYEKVDEPRSLADIERDMQKLMAELAVLKAKE